MWGESSRLPDLPLQVSRVTIPIFPLGLEGGSPSGISYGLLRSWVYIVNFIEIKDGQVIGPNVS